MRSPQERLLTYHDLEHLSPPFPRLGEEVAIFLETEA
jgi:alpha-glucosidase